MFVLADAVAFSIQDVVVQFSIIRNNLSVDRERSKMVMQLRQLVCLWSMLAAA